MSNEKRWYAVHTYAGYEHKVKATLEARIEALGLGDKIDQVLIPSEKVHTVRQGKKMEVERKFFPSYILIHMEMNDATFSVVKNTPKVTGFLGTSKPTPLADSEVAGILGQMKAGAERPQAEISIRRGQRVRVIDGPFANFVGVVDEVNPDKTTLKVMVTIFGRSTPVEVDTLQVEVV